jgi:hypothetical protein
MIEISPVWHPVLNYRPTQHAMLQFCVALSEAIGTIGTAQYKSFASNLTAFIYVSILLVDPIPPFVHGNKKSRIFALTQDEGVINRWE